MPPGSPKVGFRVLQTAQRREFGVILEWEQLRTCWTGRNNSEALPWTPLLHLQIAEEAEMECFGAGNWRACLSQARAPPPHIGDLA